jgi:hypothetical protein
MTRGSQTTPSISAQRLAYREIVRQAGWFHMWSAILGYQARHFITGWLCSAAKPFNGYSLGTTLPGWPLHYSALAFFLPCQPVFAI